jgi:hypothetical protein
VKKIMQRQTGFSTFESEVTPDLDWGRQLAQFVPVQLGPMGEISLEKGYAENWEGHGSGIE